MIIKKKKYFWLFILLMFYVISGGSSYSQSIPERPVPPRLVNDFAGMLEAGEVRMLEQKLHQKVFHELYIYHQFLILR